MNKQQRDRQKPCNQEAVTKTSLSLGIPEAVVKDITQFQGKYAEKIIKEGRFESVRLPYIGIFIARVDRISRISQYRGLLDESIIQTPK